MGQRTHRSGGRHGPARRVAVLLLSALLLLTACDDDTGDPHDAGDAEPDGATGDGPTTDGSGDGRTASNDGVAGSAGDPDATSARGGPDGTRELDTIPDELPAALVTDDARELSGTVARSGGDWSAMVTYLSDRKLDELPRILDTRLEQDGYTLDRRVVEAERAVSYYDGSQGWRMTVTVRRDAGALRTTAVIISP